MTGNQHVKAETDEAYGRIVAALDYDEAHSPQAVAVFSALMTFACQVFAQSSVSAGDTDARITEHLDAVVAHFRKGTTQTIAEFRAAILPNSNTRH